MTEPAPELLTRAENACELCKGAEGLQVHELPRSPARGIEAEVLVCEVCAPCLSGGGEVPEGHWYCLQESGWSEVQAVQVAAWRQLHQLTGQPWAEDLLSQIWLPEEVQGWAKPEEIEVEEEVRIADINGTTLEPGDSVTITKDLVVQGGGFTAKRGTLVKNIKMGDDPTHVEGNVNGVAIFIKTCFVKRA
jgi:protein PhnA